MNSLKTLEAQLRTELPAALSAMPRALAQLTRGTALAALATLSACDEPGQGSKGAFVDEISADRCVSRATANDFNLAEDDHEWSPFYPEGPIQGLTDEQIDASFTVQGVDANLTKVNLGEYAVVAGCMDDAARSASNSVKTQPVWSDGSDLVGVSAQEVLVTLTTPSTGWGCDFPDLAIAVVRRQPEDKDNCLTVHYAIEGVSLD